MDTNKWRPSQVGEAAMDAGDWRSRLQADSRQRIVNKIMDTLKRHLPFSGQDGLQELSEIAVRFEEEIYTAATSQSDYLREISLKLLTMATKSQNSMGNPLQSNSTGNGSSGMQPQVSNQASLDSSAQTGYASGGDWQKEVYQKIKVMKEGYLPELSEMYQVFATKVQKHDSLPQQPKSEKLEKLKMFKTMLERLISILQISKSSISPGLKDKLGLYEKQMVNFINTNRLRKQGPPLQQGELPPPHMHSMQQPQSQIRQVQSHENQMNPHLQTMNLQGSVPTMQQNNMTSSEQNSMSSISGVSTAQQNMMNSLQLSTNLDSGQGNALNCLQQVPVGSIQQTPVSAPHQANMNGLSSQSGVSMLQPNINSLKSNSGMLQHQQLKQQELQMFQNQLKQQNQQQMQQQFIQKQQIPATATAATVAASKAAASSADGGEPTPNATASSNE